MSVALRNTRGINSGAGRPLAPLAAPAFATAWQQLSTPILPPQCPALAIGYLAGRAFPRSGTGILNGTKLLPLDWRRLAAQLPRTPN